MGSILSLRDEIEDNPNYFDDLHQRQYEQLLKEITQVKKDFDTMTFKTFVQKYNINTDYNNKYRDYVNGKIKGLEYFKGKSWRRENF
jgi:predicted transcriptional regulator